MTQEQNFDNSLAESLENAARKDTATTSSEMIEAKWAVIGPDECAVSSLTYEQAQKFLERLEKEGISGLCIVTNEAGARLSVRKMS